MAYDDTLFQLGMGLTCEQKPADTDQREENLGTGTAHTFTRATALTGSYPEGGCFHNAAFKLGVLYGRMSPQPGQTLVWAFVREQRKVGKR